MNRLQDFLSTIRGQHCDCEIRTHEEQISSYAQDEAFRSDSLPGCVLFPKDTQAVSQILTTANQFEVPIVPRGAGTGLAGACTPTLGSVVLSLERMSQILEISETDTLAVVEPGVITGELRDAVSAKGLFYPPIPASVDSCTIGGNVATNAGGLYAVKYGVTRQYVLGLEMVLPTGEILHTGGRFVKNTVGYDFTQLVIGSEGTLAIVTKIILRLLPAPKEQITLLVPYSSLGAVTETVTAIFAQHLLPPTLEMIPQAAVQCVLKQDANVSFPFPDHAACLLIELDGTSQAHLEEQLMLLEPILTKFGAAEPMVAATKNQSEEMWSLRKQMREIIVHMGPYVEADSVVPRSKLPFLVQAADLIAKKYGTKAISYGHAGDGNLHTYFHQKSIPQDDWSSRSKEMLKDFYKETLALGGTISGEHGIGILKRGYVPLALSSTQIRLMKQVKAAFDPKNILNPGKVFPIC